MSESGSSASNNVADAAAARRRAAHHPLQIVIAVIVGGPVVAFLVVTWVQGWINAPRRRWWWSRPRYQQSRSRPRRRSRSRIRRRRRGGLQRLRGYATIHRVRVTTRNAESDLRVELAVELFGEAAADRTMNDPATLAEHDCRWLEVDDRVRVVRPLARTVVLAGDGTGGDPRHLPLSTVQRCGSDRTCTAIADTAPRWYYPAAMLRIDE